MRNCLGSIAFQWVTEKTRYTFLIVRKNREFQKVLQSFRDMRKEVGVSEIQRLQIATYKTYLKIYKLKKKGKSEGMIANMVFGKENIKGTSAIAKVGRHWKRAKQMIEEKGYKDLV